MAKASKLQCRDFGEDFLEDIAGWIAVNMTPEEVFGRENLIRYVSDNYSPGDVFEECDKD